MAGFSCTFGGFQFDGMGMGVEMVVWECWRLDGMRVRVAIGDR